MSVNHDLERRIADFYETEAPPAAPDWVLRDSLATIDITPQRRALIRVPWRRVPPMNTFARFAVAAVAVIAVGAIGVAILRPGTTPGIGGALSPSPSATPSPVPSPSSPPKLTESYTSAVHGFTISYPADWNVRAATEPWTAGIPFQQDPSGDLIETSNNRFLLVASQPRGGRSSEAWFDAVSSNRDWDDTCEPATVPVTIDGASGLIVTHCDGTLTALVAVADRGYLVVLFGFDESEAWFQEILASMRLDPEGAIDGSPYPSP
jgi:hypothetical protein